MRWCNALDQGVASRFASGEKMLEQTPSGAGAHLGALVLKDRIWVLGADRHVWSTTDGVNWTQVTDHAAFGDRACAAVAVYDNKLWVMGGRTEAPNDLPEGTYKRFTTHNDVWRLTLPPEKSGAANQAGKQQARS